MDWYVYIIGATDGRLYTGITTDIERRWKEHSCSARGAKFFRGRKPKDLLYLVRVLDRSEASKREFKIKKLKRHEKQTLIESSENQISKLAVKMELVLAETFN